MAGVNPEFEVGEVGMRYARDAWIGVDRDPCPAGLESLFLAGLAGCGGPHSATSTAKNVAVAFIALEAAREL